MRASRIFLALSLLVLPLPALALGFVIGKTAGRECYEATLTGSDPITERLAINACDRAVADAEMDSHAQATALVNRAAIRLRMAQYPAAQADADASLALEPDLAEA